MQKQEMVQTYAASDYTEAIPHTILIVSGKIDLN